MSNPEEDVFVIRGGQGASKTVSILQLIIQSLVSSEKEASVLSSELAKMKRTVIRDYKKICKDWGVMSDESDFNKSESKHEYQSGSYLDFLGADVNDVGKGFRRDILYINEADKLDIDTAVQFISRAKLTIIDYNPDALFWGDDYINENNFITLTFEDNEYLSESEVKSILDYKKKGFHNPNLPEHELFKESNIKNNYWANKWKVYGLGQVGSLDGVVFMNWKEIDSIPPNAKYVKTGVDFGYTNDPTTIIDKYILDGVPIYDEVLYQKGLTNSQIAKELKTSKRIVVADSAEPKSIKEISTYGINITGAEKGKDSVNFGVQNIQNYELFYVTKGSKNLIEELTKYTWARDRKTGKSLNHPIDDYNHCFIGETKIQTDKGLIEIKEINEDDYVLTSDGYKKVLKKWDNGVKKVNKYWIVFDTFKLSLCCTDNHLIKTTKGWKQIKELKESDSIYLHNPIKEKNSIYTKERGIIHQVEKECTFTFGNQKTKPKYPKDSMCTIKTKILTTIHQTIWNWLNPLNTCESTVRIDSSKTKNGLTTFTQRALKRLRSGISQQRGWNGIGNTLKGLISELKIMELESVIIAQKNTIKNHGKVDSVLITANQHLEEKKALMMLNSNANNVEPKQCETNIQAQSIVSISVVESWSERVYDLMVEDCHEYFANGILVHNCIDAIRYVEESEKLSPKPKLSSSGLRSFKDYYK